MPGDVPGVGFPPRAKRTIFFDPHNGENRDNVILRKAKLPLRVAQLATSRRWATNQFNRWHLVRDFDHSQPYSWQVQT